MYLRYFKTIEIEFLQMEMFRFGEGHRIQQYTGGFANEIKNDRQFFGQVRNQEYSTNEKTVQIECVKEGIESFGTIYQELFHWFQQIQLHSDQSQSKVVKFCFCSHNFN